MERKPGDLTKILRDLLWTRPSWGEAPQKGGEAKIRLGHFVRELPDGGPMIIQVISGIDLQRREFLRW